MISVDLAKNTFEIAIRDPDGHPPKRHRLTRAKFAQFFVQRPPAVVVMEACGSAHYWGRHIAALGHEVRLLPAQYVKPYVKRNKTDRADAAALLEAARSPDIKPVPIKTVHQQTVLALHRLRSQWQRAQHRYLNILRGTLREFGLFIPLGAAVAQSQVGEMLAKPDNGLPDVLRVPLTVMLEEARELNERINAVERDLTRLCRDDQRARQLREIPGIGVLNSTALHAAVGDIHRFPSGRHFASWLGITASERSSAERRRLGRISKQGDTRLRTLLVHGARSALLSAQRAQRSRKPITPLQQWAIECEKRRGHNKATVALANRMARIIWATWKHDRPFDATYGRQAA
jgi:transposase